MTTDIQPAYFFLKNVRYQGALGKAVFLHCLVLLLAFMAPHVFQYRFKLPDIQTVTLYSVSELAEKIPTQQKVIEQQPMEQATKPDKPVVSLNTQPLPKPPPVVVDIPAKIISLRPIKRKKIVSKPVERPPVPSKVQQFRKQQAAQQLLAAEKEAELTRKQALDRIRQNLKNRPAVAVTTPTVQQPTAPVAAASTTTTQTTQASPAGAQGTVKVEEYIGQYVFEVRQLIRQYWQLPDLRNWDPTLEGIIVVKVRKNGEIIKSYFEKRSTNKFYNQSLEKALKSAGKLPPLPAELKDDTYEFGLRFRLSDML